METNTAVDADWRYVLGMLPDDLEATAVACGALQRRREVQSAGDLLRLAMAYALCEWSLRQTAAWAALREVAAVSDVALLKRLRGASEWLGRLVVQWLDERGLTQQVPPLTVEVVDASVISRPGSRGTDWRLHLRLDLAQRRMVGVELTGASGGETLLRHVVRPGVVLLADRGYAHRAGVARVLRDEGHVLVRLNWQNFPLQSRSGRSVSPLEMAETLEEAEVGDWAVQFAEGGEAYPMRFCAVRKTAAAALHAQERIRRAASRKQHEPDPRSLQAAHFVFVLTDLEPTLLPPAQALELYRLRWQIEMTFKRLKGLHQLDHVRAKSDDLAATYLYAKLLGALVTDELCRTAVAFSPWGYGLFAADPQPLAAGAVLA